MNIDGNGISGLTSIGGNGENRIGSTCYCIDKFIVITVRPEILCTGNRQWGKSYRIAFTEGSIGTKVSLEAEIIFGDNEGIGTQAASCRIGKLGEVAAGLIDEKGIIGASVVPLKVDAGSRDRIPEQQGIFTQEVLVGINDFRKTDEHGILHGTAKAVGAGDADPLGAADADLRVEGAVLPLSIEYSGGARYVQRAKGRCDKGISREHDLATETIHEIGFGEFFEGIIECGVGNDHFTEYAGKICDAIKTISNSERPGKERVEGYGGDGRGELSVIISR